MSGAQHLYGEASVANTVSASEHAIDQAAVTLSSIAHGVNEARDRVHDLADRLFGTRPEASNKNVSKIANPGAVGNLEAHLAGLHILLASLHDEISRIEKL